MAKPVPACRPSGFFALRTPTLPFDDLLAFGSDLKMGAPPTDPKLFADAVASDLNVLRERLRKVVARPEVRQALFVASPSLDEALSKWLLDAGESRARDAELPILRYYQRMAGRCTP